MIHTKIIMYYLTTVVVNWVFLYSNKKSTKKTIPVPMHKIPSAVAIAPPEITDAPTIIKSIPPIQLINSS